MLKINWIIIHHTGGTDKDPLADTSNHTFEDVNSWHRQSPLVWLGNYSTLGYAIGYTYFIDKQGKVTQGRADDEQSAHTRGYNNNPWDSLNNSSIGICMAGNFDFTIPTQEQIQSLKKLVKAKMLEYNIPIERVVPHRHMANKTCYGNNLSNDWLKQILMDNPVAITPCIAQEKVIEEQKQTISRLQALINSIISWFNKK